MLQEIAQCLAIGAQARSDVKRLSLETMGMIAARRIKASAAIPDLIQSNITAFCVPALQHLLNAMLEDPGSGLAAIELLADTLLALMLAEQATFQSTVQRMITEASEKHRARLGEIFTGLISGLSGEYTRPAKMSFRGALRQALELVVSLVATSGTPVLAPKTL